ncbi:choice-of-anchor D domain-containing protein [Fulvivirga sp.]|uniref:Ig-like domain-containing protein n=1 Tax=Fulvivirga sp. TaxID=1931237 RepID=UPI0032F06C4E
MKQLLTIFFITISFIGFGQEINFKTIRVKVKPQHVQKFNLKSHKKSAAGYVQTGHTKLDKVNDELEVISYSRVFSEGGVYKKRREAFGLHLWYDVTFKRVSPSLHADRLLQFKNLEEIDVAEPVYEKSLDLIEGVSPKISQIENTRLSDKSPSFLPNDPRFDEQWHYNNTGQTGGLDDADIDLPEAWNTQKGSDNVIVAIIDGGIDVSHEDLSGNIWVNSVELSGTPGVDDDGNGYIDDINGYNFADNTGPISAHNHGTHVAGTVGAETNNGIGVSGVAGGTGSDDGVRLMSVQVFSNASQGGFAESFAYAADNGAIIAQNSWGYTSAGFYEQSVLDGIDYFIANAGYDADNNPIGPMQGGIVIFAAGNDNSDGAHYPGYYEPTLAVSSTNHNDQKSWYSNYGSWVDIAAPGGETSITSQGVLSTLPGNSYGFYQGTSMACPHVAGVAALIVSQFGGDGFTPAQLRARLVETTDYIDDKNSGYEGLLGQGRVNAAATLLVNDGIPPENISDLTLESTRFNAIDLTWTAPFDEDNGSSASYEIRYSTSIINEENFDMAVLGAVKLASDAGASEEHTLEGLVSETTYFVAIKSSDYFGNSSLISNVISFETPAPPVISVSPLSLVSDLFTGGTETHTLTISNNGYSDLIFEIGRSSTQESAVKQVDNTLLSKGQTDKRVGTPVLNGQGEDGSEYGYNWKDSNEPTGPDFVWEDISSTGINLNLGDDNYELLSLPFEVEYYGEVKSDIYISSNGFISFSQTGASSLSYNSFPNPNTPNDVIAGLWTDLNPGAGGGVYYQTESDKVIIQYDQVPLYSAGGSYTFQIILYENGEIRIQYLSLSSILTSFSTGIENSDGTEGMTIAFNTAYLENELAILVSNSGSLGLEFEPDFGLVGAGESIDVLVDVDASGLIGGVYEETIKVFSNDPLNPVVEVDLTVNVTGAPHLDLDKNEFDFGDIFIGDTLSDSVLVTNGGTDVLNITSITNSEPEFTISNSELSLDPQESVYVLIQFNPTLTGAINDIIVFESNDPDFPVLNVYLTGNGVEPPIIDASPGSFAASLLTGESEFQELVISNNGSSDLNVSITPRAFNVSATSNEPKNTPILKSVDYSKKDTSTKNGQHFSSTIKNSFIETLSDSIIIYSQDFEAGAIDWSHYSVDGAIDSWMLTTARSNSGSYSYNVAQHDSQGSDALESPQIILDDSDELILAFSHWYEFDDCADPNFEVDGVIIEISTDGSNWMKLEPLSGYPYILDDECGNPIAGEDAYSHSNGEFTVDLVDLSDYAGQSVQVRFLAGWDCGNCAINEGWYLDDFVIYNSASWLNVSQRELSISPGMSESVDVLFDASGLFGGVYDGDLQLVSNDPITPEILLPVTLNVTGAPDIEVEELTLDFGDVFVGISKTDSILVSNLGTDVLNISNITNGLTEYVISIDDVTLDPFETTYIRLSYNPTSASVNTDVIEILSDDSDESLIEIDLIGTGIQPPVIEVNPLDVTSNLYSGESEVQTITISNAGVADLNYSLVSSGYISNNDFQMLDSEVDRSNSSVNSSDDIIEAVNSINSSILVIQNTTEWGLDMQSYIMANFGISSTVIGYESISSTNFDSYDLIITLGDQIGSYYDAISTNVAKFEDFVSNGGIVQYQLATQGSNVSIVDGVQVIYGSQENFNVFIDGTHPVVKNAVNPLEGSLANHAVISNLPASAIIITQTQDSDEVTTAEYKYGSGTVLVTGMTWGFLVNNNYPAGILLSNTLDYLINELNTFIDINPIEGVITAGQSVEIDLTIDASNLNGGIYESSIIVSSNDPANAEIIVPITLNVTGAPDIYLDDNSIDFGEVFLSGALMDSLRIVNTGTDVLEISDILNSGSDFELSIGSMSLSPGESTYLYITFTPTSFGEITDQIEIQSNDVDELSVFVDLVGVGLELPIITVDPSSLTSNLNIDQSEIKEVQITNTGGSPLLYDLVLESIATSQTKVLNNSIQFIGTERSKDESPQNDPSTIENQSVSSNDIRPMNVGSVSSLEEVLGSLELINSELVDLIPNRYNFSGGVSGSTISDGGGDMYDGGNALLTNLGGNFNYSDKLITSTPYLNGQDYFTAKYDGLFVFASDLDNNSEFIIEGNLGADGGGSVDASILNLEISGRSFLGFVKRVYGTSDPSVNHLIIVEDRGTLGHEFSTDSDNDFHRVYGLEDSQRLYYLLFAGTSGGYINDSDILSIMESFVLSVDKTRQISLVSPNNGSLAPGSSEIIEVEFNSYGVSEGTYGAELVISGQDQHIDNMIVPLTLNVALDAYPEISIDKGLVDFGAVQLGDIKRDTIVISNNGTSNLNIDDLASINSSFSYSIPDRVIAPGEESKLVITFEADKTGSYSDVLNIVSNDPSNSSKFVSVRGDVIGTPDIQIDPESFHKEIIYARLDSIEFIISNDGASQLEVNLLGGDLIVIDDKIRNVEIQPGSSRKITIKIDAAGFEIGHYESYVRVTSNDPNKSLIDIPIIIDVVLGAQISVASQVDFGSVHVMDIMRDSVFIYNEGDSDLEILDIQVDNDAFMVSVNSNTIASGDSTLLKIEFAPKKEESYEGFILINSNTSNNSPLSIDLSGSGYCNAPSITQEIGRLEMVKSETKVLILTEFFTDMNGRQLSYSNFEFDASILDVSISGEQLTIEANKPGLSNVIFNIDNGLCEAMEYLFTVNVDEVTSVTDSDNLYQNLKLYPNPAGNEISIQISNNDIATNDGRIVITDVASKEVLSISVVSIEDTLYKIDISSLEESLYFIEFHQGNTIYRGKFIKK